MTEDADVVLLGMGTISTPVKVAIRKMRAARQESRFRAPALVPSVPGRGTREVPGTLQGSRRHRPRFLVRFAQSERCRGHRSSFGPVSGRLGPKPPVLDFICGLGGREVTVPDVEKMTDIVFQAARR